MLKRLFGDTVYKGRKGVRCARYKERMANMAKEESFDVVSQVDMQEVDNAYQQGK